MLIAQWQYAVTRKDMAETFSFEEFKEVLSEFVRYVILFTSKVHHM